MSRFIKVAGQSVEVTDEVYAAYYYGARRERYYERDIKVGRIDVDMEKQKVTFVPSKEDSCERLMELGADFEAETSVDEIVADKAMLLILREALSELDAEERGLIEKKYDYEKTYREIGDEFGISHTALRKRHDKIIKKLKTYF